MWIKLKNRLYNLDRINAIELETIDTHRIYLCFYTVKGYMFTEFNSAVESDNIFKKIQELIAYGGCSFFDFDKDNEK